MLTRILAPWAKDTCHQLGIAPTSEFTFIPKSLTGWSGWVPIPISHLAENGEYLMLNRSTPCNMMVVDPCEVAAFHWMYKEAQRIASLAFIPTPDSSAAPIGYERVVNMLFAWMYEDVELQQWEWELIGEYFFAHPYRSLNMTTARPRLHHAINVKLIHVARIRGTRELYIQNF